MFGALQSPLSASSSGVSGAPPAAARGCDRTDALHRWRASDVGAYERLERLGEGRFGVVYHVRRRDRPGESFAEKRVNMTGEANGFPITAIREIKALRSLSHKNIVRLVDVVTAPPSDHNRNTGDVSLIFERADFDLRRVITRFTPMLSTDFIRCVMRQLLEALAYAHSLLIAHRDVKPDNVLVTSRNAVKLADWNLARSLNPRDRSTYTREVVTLWYRAPELLLGCGSHGTPVDMWSAGCVLYELFAHEPLFRSEDVATMTEAIFDVCGTPTPDSWPEVRPTFAHKPRVLRDRFIERMPALAVDLLDRLLRLNPAERLSAVDALNHPFILGAPEPDTLPLINSTIRAAPARPAPASSAAAAAPHFREAAPHARIDMDGPARHPLPPAARAPPRLADVDVPYKHGHKHALVAAADGHDAADPSRPLKQPRLTAQQSDATC